MAPIIFIAVVLFVVWHTRDIGEDGLRPQERREIKEREEYERDKEMMMETMREIKKEMMKKMLDEMTVQMKSEIMEEMKIKG